MSEILQVILMPARKQTFLLFMLRMDLVIFRIHQDRLAQSGNFLLFLDCRFSLFMFLVQDYIAVFSIIQHQQSLPPVVSFHTHDNIRVIGQNVLMANPSHQTFYPHYVSRSKQLHHPRLKDSFPIDSSHSFADK